MTNKLCVYKPYNTAFCVKVTLLKTNVFTQDSHIACLQVKPYTLLYMSKRTNVSLWYLTLFYRSWNRSPEILMLLTGTYNVFIWSQNGALWVESCSLRGGNITVSFPFYVNRRYTVNSYRVNNVNCTPTWEEHFNYYALLLVPWLPPGGIR